MNGMLVGAFCYADDVTLLAPTGMALNAMLGTCTRFADAHNRLYNSSKTKRMFIDRSCSQLDSNIQFMGRSVEFVNSVDLLRFPLYADFNDNHIHLTPYSYFVTCIYNIVLRLLLIVISQIYIHVVYFRLHSNYYNKYI